MNRLNNDRSLTDCGGDPLDRARADIAHREDTRQVGLKGVGGHRCISAASLSRQDETVVIEAYRVLEPPSTGCCTDHDEESANGSLRHMSFAVGGS